MNKFAAGAALSVAALLSFGLGSASNAQTYERLPELSHAKSAHVIHLKDTFGPGLPKAGEVQITAASLEKMSESSTVRVGCGPGAINFSQTIQAAEQAPANQLFIAGLAICFFGGAIMLFSSFAGNWWVRASKGMKLFALLTLGITYKVLMGFSSNEHTLVAQGVINCIYPLAATGLLCPRLAGAATRSILAVASGCLSAACSALLLIVARFVPFYEWQGTLSPVRGRVRPSGVAVATRAAIHSGPRWILMIGAAVAVVALIAVNFQSLSARVGTFLTQRGRTPAVRSVTPNVRVIPTMPPILR